jgi:hypothetical protein
MCNKQHVAKLGRHLWKDAIPNPKAGMFPFSRTWTDWKEAHPKAVLNALAYPVTTTPRRSSQWSSQWSFQQFASPAADIRHRQRAYILGHYVPNGPRGEWSKGQYGVYTEEQAAWRTQRDQDRLEGLRHKLEKSIDPAVPGYLQRIVPKCKPVQIESISHTHDGEYSHRVPAINPLVSPLAKETSSEKSKEAEGVEERLVSDSTTALEEGAAQSRINGSDNELAKSTLREGMQTLIKDGGLHDDEDGDGGECYTVTRFPYGLADSARTRRYHD